MQMVSDAYRKSIRQLFRNRGYIKGSIGVINTEAQGNAKIADTKLATWSKPDIYDSSGAKKLYATAEENFTKANGNFYFVDDTVTGNTGAITDSIMGTMTFIFNGGKDYNIKGLTIDFGDCYPEVFVLQVNGSENHTYSNASPVWTCTDVFDGARSFKIIPQQMSNEAEARLRIYSIQFGMVDTFGSDEVLSCSVSEYVSPIAESIPSKDIDLKLDNLDGMYSPDNDSSAAAYLELGQEIRIAFGYDVDGLGTIEWLPEIKSYLKSWSATKTDASFTCTDLFDGTMDKTYYGGKYSETGKTLYALAEEVLADAGVAEEDYFLDEYLKEVTVNNPVPAVKHSEALQLIANAGRCVLRDDRDGRIYIQSSFTPDVTATSVNTDSDHSNLQAILQDVGETKAYAMSSRDFVKADGSMLFDGDNQSNIVVSNVSADTDGNFTSNPSITLSYERVFDAYGFSINFVGNFPIEFTVTAYSGDIELEKMVCSPEYFMYQTSHTFYKTDKLVFEFTKGSPESVVAVSNIAVNGVTDYDLADGDDITTEPTVTRTEKLRNLTTNYTKFVPSSNATEIATQDMTVTGNTTYTFYFTDPSFNMFAVVEEDGKSKTAIKAKVTASSNYYATVAITGVKAKTKIKVTLNGNYYTKKVSANTVNYQKSGNDVTWDNPLVSTKEHAQDLNEWLSTYYLGKVEYEIGWRGDPRTDANDIFYYTRADGEKYKIRAYQNDFDFDGGFSGKIKARMVIE